MDSIARGRRAWLMGRDQVGLVAQRRCPGGGVFDTSQPHCHKRFREVVLLVQRQEVEPAGTRRRLRDSWRIGAGRGHATGGADEAHQPLETFSCSSTYRRTLSHRTIYDSPSSSCIEMVPGTSQTQRRRSRSAGVRPSAEFGEKPVSSRVELRVRYYCQCRESGFAQLRDEAAGTGYPCMAR